jgi:hypothetical protein
VWSNRTVLPGEAEALEARFGLRVTARLNAGADGLSHDVSERLRIARQQAVAMAANPATAARRIAATTAHVVAAQPSSGSAALGLMGGERGGSWWNWLAGAVPVLLLLLGLVGIDHWQQLELIGATADIDVALLGDDLPPSAFTDPGFAEFLLEPVVETAPQ